MGPSSLALARRTSKSVGAPPGSRAPKTGFLGPLFLKSKNGVLFFVRRIGTAHPLAQFTPFPLTDFAPEGPQIPKQRPGKHNSAPEQNIAVRASRAPQFCPAGENFENRGLFSRESFRKMSFRPGSRAPKTGFLGPLFLKSKNGVLFLCAGLALLTP